MKKLIAALSLSLLMFGTTKAQVTLEHTYTNGNISVVNLTNGGYKYYLLDKINNQCLIYNTNHSIYKIINLPTLPSGYTNGSIFSLSDQLFNTDTLIEFELLMDNSIYQVFTTVYNENGIIIVNSFPSFGGRIYNLNGNFKYVTATITGDTTLVYSLPGTLPCDACGGEQTTKVNNLAETNMHRMANPYPNPTDGQITIPYTFPAHEKKGKLSFYDVSGKLVKEFMVDDTFNSLVLQSNDLATGTYYYKLVTASGSSESKKIVVIKH